MCVGEVWRILCDLVINEIGNVYSFIIQCLFIGSFELGPIQSHHWLLSTLCIIQAKSI